MSAGGEMEIEDHHQPIQSEEIHTKARLWNPVKDIRPPSEDEFDDVEASFGRYVNFMKNREEAGLSPDAVRLLHNFYSNLGTDNVDLEGSSAKLEALVHPDLPVDQLVDNFSIRKTLEGRHLEVLINLIMLKVEEEQNELKELMKFYDLLQDSKWVHNYPAEKLNELRALTQEQIRLKLDLIAKLKSGRALMFKGFEGSQRLLSILKRKAAKRARKDHLREFSKIRDELEPTNAAESKE